MVIKIRRVLMVSVGMLSPLAQATQPSPQDIEIDFSYIEASQQDKNFLGSIHLAKEEVEETITLLNQVSKNPSYQKQDMLCARLYTQKDKQLVGISLFQKILPKKILFIF